MASQARQLADKSIAPPGRRNLIINGAMQVAQRGTSVTGISGPGYKALDRMRHSSANTSTSRFTQEQVSDAPDGFSNSLKLTTTTAEGGIPADGRVSVIDYRIEAQDLQHLKYGTSDAKKITLSFWVKSSLTGLTTVGIYAPDGVRSIGRSYTINSANTWEYKTLTFDGDTGGTINDDNGIGLEILFQVAAGSDYTSTPIQTSWGASSNFNDEFNGGNTFNLIDTLNATFQITGIQLEVGSTATEFEHRSYGEEFALCERYYEIANPLATVASGTYLYGQVISAIAKRAAPTGSLISARYYRPGVFDVSVTSGFTMGGASFSTNSNGYYFFNTATGVTSGDATTIYGKVVLDAEL
tara:strand:+ start:1589 stop:2653 length:1065 start_codon:yes stop_codon:yes gene_type:complete